MIREAELKDLPELYRMSFLFLEEANILKDVPANREDVYNWCLNLINDPTSTCIVYEDQGVLRGAIAGSINPHFINKDFKVANEFAWWVDPNYRGKIGKQLLKAFELWAITNRANMIVMASLESIYPETMDKIYKSLGYSSTEHSYIKVI